MLIGTRYIWPFTTLTAAFLWACLVFLTTKERLIFNSQMCEPEEEKLLKEKNTSLDEEEFIFQEESSVPVELNNLVLLNYIRNQVLKPPLPLPYNLIHSKDDPSEREGQNRIVLELLKNKSNGIFIEAGASDGETLSTTLMLERDYGWTGFLIEPHSSAFAELESKSRKAWLANICLSHKIQKVKFLEYKRVPSWSKLENVSQHHKTWIKAHIKENIVKCFPLFSVLLSVGVTEIDYLSLDVEGAEFEVLRGFPFDQMLIRVLSIAYNHIRLEPGLDDALKKLMTDNGYRLVTDVFRGSARDYIYAHSSVS